MAAEPLTIRHDAARSGRYFPNPLTGDPDVSLLKLLKKQTVGDNVAVPIREDDVPGTKSSWREPACSTLLPT